MQNIDILILSILMNLSQMDSLPWRSGRCSHPLTKKSIVMLSGLGIRNKLVGGLSFTSRSLAHRFPGSSGAIKKTSGRFRTVCTRPSAEQNHWALRPPDAKMLSKLHSHLHTHKHTLQCAYTHWPLPFSCFPSNRPWTSPGRSILWALKLKRLFRALPCTTEGC